MLRGARLATAIALIGSTSAGSAAAEPSAATLALNAAKSPKVAGDVSILFRARPSLGGGWLAAEQRAPVVVELDRRPTSGDIERLAAAGLRLATREDGSTVARDVFVAGRVAAAALTPVANTAHVVRVHADAAPFGAMPPLDTLGAELQVPDVWREQDAFGSPLTGLGQLVCVIDVGMDVFHPMFFHADGGFWGWRDVDGNGVFSDGVDTLGDGTVLRSFNSRVLDFHGGELYGTGEPGHIAGIDWVYADQNGNGKRDKRAEFGFTDASPAFGEPLFTSDDVNGNTVLDSGERLVALYTSKVQLYNTRDYTYTRGVDMSAAPRSGTHHGTASTSIVAGGQRGYGRFVGVAPDAELIMVKTSTISQIFSHTDFCLSRGARVVLHEYAVWQSFFLDGSSPLERVIASSMQQGVAHITPAGNLAGGKKMYKRELARGGSLDIAVEVPPTYDDEPFALFAFSLLWSGDKADLEVTLTDGTGTTMTVPDSGAEQPFHSGLLLLTDRQESDRGTARVDVYVFSDLEGTVKIAPGRWNVAVRDRAGAGPYTLVGTLTDDQSRWDVGIHFPDYINEDHLFVHPATADDAIVVGAYVGHGFWGGTPGMLAPKSSRGTRIDGLSLLSVAAPEDAIAAAYFEDQLAPLGPFSGTSGASPHVAAAAALLFQSDPALTGLAVRDRIRSGALSDDDTGFVPNDDWGYGKLRIYNSLTGENPIPGAAPVVDVATHHADVGETITVRASIHDPDDALQTLTVELDRNYDGVYDEQLTDGTFTVSFDDVGPHFLKVRATDPSGRSGAVLARVDVHATYVPAGGCALVAPRTTAKGSWLVLLLGWIVRMRYDRGSRPPPREPTPA